MARRSDNTREELKKMAIEAGLDLLEESGPEKLSVRKIAARIGYTVGTLYNVFDDFEDIVLHLNAATLHDMHAQLAALANTRKKPQQRILDFAHCYGAYALAHQARWKLLHQSSRVTKLPEWFLSDVHHIFALVDAPLKELSKQKPAITNDAAKVLWAGLHGICALSLSQKLERLEAGPMHLLIDNFVQHYMKGLEA
ncbi:MAG: TetR/AcrR family transcriptional regulator [Pseudomonadota bacterium]